VNSVERNVNEILGRLAQQNKNVGESLTVRSFQAGETVCKASEMARSVFLVASGRIQLYRTTPDGRQFVIATLGPGSMFGEDSLLGDRGPIPTPWPWSRVQYR
jgi:CRP/FNR family transcriptional regulator